ncbi:hypothetical protein LR48_Vigan02g001300 [Vigna angularis]|uniref:Uncharacterized protein n=1 Tax=Phaseolus angularis TaxID=3914 RepID=A0A0L9TTE6_PHAAN|nr:hypothetical protein LR48_Vigan02g001300 [Vigna angularis]
MRSFPRLCAPPPAAGISENGGWTCNKTSDDQVRKGFYPSIIISEKIPYLLRLPFIYNYAQSTVKLSRPTAEDRPQKTNRGGYVETDRKLSGPIDGLLRMYSGRLSKHVGYSGRLSVHGSNISPPSPSKIMILCWFPDQGESSPKSLLELALLHDLGLRSSLEACPKTKVLEAIRGSCSKTKVGAHEETAPPARFRS